MHYCYWKNYWYCIFSVLLLLVLLLLRVPWNYCYCYSRCQSACNSSNGRRCTSMCDRVSNTLLFSKKAFFPPTSFFWQILWSLRIKNVSPFQFPLSPHWFRETSDTFDSRRSLKLFHSLFVKVKSNLTYAICEVS